MRVGAVDIGTNSTRLLVAERGPDGLRWLEHRVAVTRLGRGVDADRRLGEEGMASTLEALAAYRQAAEAAGVDSMRAVATSATRDAANRAEFLDRAEDALGTRPEVITGEVEAELSFRGATAGMDAGPVLVVDPGGGSTEFVYGTGEPEMLVSVDIGSVRLTERALPDRPADEVDVVAAASSVEAMFGDVHLPDRPPTVVGVGGTFTSLAAIALDLPRYDRLQVHRSVLGRSTLTSLIAELAGMTVEETAAIPSLDPARAPVLLAGAVVAEAALRHVGVDEVIVSESDILDGIAAGLLEEAS